VSIEAGEEEAAEAVAAEESQSQKRIKSTIKTPVKVINRKKSAHVCVSVTGQCFCVSFCINECVKVEILLPIIIMTIYK